ncbi:PREDICTED: probable serine hydrolase [Nicrophorus vespilloides]|uniref:Probable serine hydrolase n=1 Tax=Nicrophorus vespilloides TaxID=110193 RepID=A0ABM1MXK4_NICVS|nr:PREDICTED: probable serine hydrolase [Nicrophorus vespilloides]
MSANNTNGFRVDDTQGHYEEVKIPVPWGHIAGKWWGSKDQQPVLAIHGWQDNAGTFDNLAPHLVKANLSVLCLDMPGHGYSSHYPPGLFYYIFWDGVHVLRRVVKHYKWSSVKLLGHSMGGAISFLYAAFYPEEVDCYVALDIASPAVRDSNKMYNVTAGAVDRFLKYEGFDSGTAPTYRYKQMLEIVVEGYEGSVTEESCHVLMRRGTRSDNECCDQYTFTRDPRLKLCALGTMDINQAVDLARRVKCRVMNVRAVHSHTHSDPGYYDKVLDVVEKNARVLVRVNVDGTHHVHLNNAERVAGHVVDFLLDEDDDLI